MKSNLNFGQALEAVKEGKLIAREGWNGKGMFVFQRPNDNLDVDFVINGIKSIPQSVKDWFDRNTRRNLKEPVIITFTAYLCMKAADNSIVNGWLASQTDMLAEDWCILN